MAAGPKSRWKTKIAPAGEAGCGLIFEKQKYFKGLILFTEELHTYKIQ